MTTPLCAPLAVRLPRAIRWVDARLRLIGRACCVGRSEAALMRALSRPRD